MSIAIEIKNISKIYRLGVISSKSITQDLNRFIARIRGKEDPYLKIGQINNRKDKSTNGFVWALKDINFDIRCGEIIGIIGKNGAGKSTLLKILSRVTSPTTGSVRVKGRVASLLEVGTGFHQELTGRENIFLNGSILGMTRKEIKGKFDEILDFSGVEKFIDTPVKRYSSGMYVRLAFAVAAHLDPEILIVDEVLAVGDAEFQNKCLGKMHEVSEKEGRTVLFVSHNMGAVKNLCSTSIVLEKGMIKNIGNTDDIISEYLSNTIEETKPVAEFENKNTEAYIKKISIAPEKSNKPSAEIDVSKSFTISFEYFLEKNIPGMSLGFSVYSNNGTKIIYSSIPISKLINSSNIKRGLNIVEVEIPGLFFAPGKYFINASIQIENIQLFDQKENVLSFNIIESGSIYNKFKGKDIGVVLADFKWNTVKNNMMIN